MRIIGQIEHPDLKITVFKSDNRISVKFENEGYEQTYKLGTDERSSSLEAVRQWVDAGFIAEVLHQMQAMHRSRLAAFVRAFPAPVDSPFEEII